MLHSAARNSHATERDLHYAWQEVHRTTESLEKIYLALHEDPPRPLAKNVYKTMRRVERHAYKLRKHMHNLRKHMEVLEHQAERAREQSDKRNH